MLFNLSVLRFSPSYHKSLQKSFTQHILKCYMDETSLFCKCVRMHAFHDLKSVNLLFVSILLLSFVSPLRATFAWSHSRFNLRKGC